MSGHKPSAMVTQTSAALAPVAVTRRVEGVRRTDDLCGWARILGEGIRLAETQS